MFKEIIIFGISILIYICFKFMKNYTKVPHGTKETPIEEGLPIIGVISQVEPPLAEYLIKLGEKHGSLFRIKFGLRRIFILNDFEIMKKVLVDDGNNSSGRWKIFGLVLDYHNSGIVPKDGKLWAEQRSFVLKVLRDFGLGKSRSLEIVQSECSDLLKELETFGERSINFANIIPIYTMNIISKFIMNIRFTRGNSNLQIIEDILKKVAKQNDLIQLFHLMVPHFDNWDWVCKLLMAVANRSQQFVKVHQMFQAEIDEHLRRLNTISEGQDLIDQFLIEQRKLKEKNGDVGTFTYWQLIRIAFELFVAGYETTSTTLTWSMMFMSRYPEIQKRVYNEIVDTIGKERMPTMNDKKSLNYTQAVMDEILRLSTVAPLAVIHRTFEDTSVNGYFIPKNSLLFPNLLSCHRDSKVWEKPFEFYPEHFLRKNEKGELKYTPREELIPFGLGKRQCLGESLARMEYMVFFLSILQKFEVRSVGKISEEDYQKTIKGNDGMIRFSPIKDFIFKSRSSD